MSLARIPSFLREVLDADAFRDGDFAGNRQRLGGKREPRRRHKPLHRTFLLAARNITLSRTTGRCGTAWRSSWGRRQGTLADGAHRAAHGTPSLPRGRAGRMHGTTLTGTQRRTRRAGGRSCSRWHSALLRAGTLEQRLPTDRLARRAGSRRRRRTNRLHWCVINRARTGLGHNHTASRKPRLTGLSRTNDVASGCGGRMRRRRRGKMSRLSFIGLCRRRTRRLWRTRRN